MRKVVLEQARAAQVAVQRIDVHGKAVKAEDAREAESDDGKMYVSCYGGWRAAPPSAVCTVVIHAADMDTDISILFMPPHIIDSAQLPACVEFINYKKRRHGTKVIKQQLARHHVKSQQFEPEGNRL
eukprot:6214073-Pleurochrysis_carterae.AAC.1